MTSEQQSALRQLRHIVAKANARNNAAVDVFVGGLEVLLLLIDTQSAELAALRSAMTNLLGTGWKLDGNDVVLPDTGMNVGSLGAAVLAAVAKQEDGE